MKHQQQPKVTQPGLDSLTLASNSYSLVISIERLADRVTVLAKCSQIERMRIKR